MIWNAPIYSSFSLKLNAYFLIIFSLPTHQMYHNGWKCIFPCMHTYLLPLFIFLLFLVWMEFPSLNYSCSYFDLFLEPNLNIHTYTNICTYIVMIIMVFCTKWSCFNLLYSFCSNIAVILFGFGLWFFFFLSNSYCFLSTYS